MLMPTLGLINVQNAKELLLPAFAEAALRVLMSAKHSANALSSCRIWGIVRCAHSVGTDRANVH